MPEFPMKDPFVWFKAWLDEAVATGMPDPNAMTVATIDPDGTLSARIILLKEWDERGFVFYTNLRSRKGQALKATPQTSLSVYWRELGRQIRIEGVAEQVADEQADAYFASRHPRSQVGAWASQQSEPLESREALIAQADAVAEKYEGREIPRPPHWSGFRVVPSSIEFWQSGEFRLHDRWQLSHTASKWSVQRLNP